MAAGDCVPFVLVGFVVLGGSSGIVGVEVKSSWTNKLDAVAAAVTLWVTALDATQAPAEKLKSTRSIQKFKSLPSLLPIKSS
jgi:hypothetical protein